MVYEYKCQEHGNVDVYKSHTLSDRQETCDVCQKPMERVFVPTANLNAGASAMRGEFYHAFGKHFDNRSQLKNEISRIEGETGKKIVEIGSDRMDNVKPKRAKINEAEAVRELSHRLKHG